MALFLSRRDIQQLVQMDEAITAVEAAFAAFSAGEAVVPLRTPVPVPENNGVTLFMPGYLPGSGSLGLKVVSVFKDNPARGKATINAVFLLVSPETGETLAVMEAGYLTALRTGAASGVATKYLAKTATPVVAVFGAGTQARTQLAAAHAVRKLKRVNIYDLSPAAVENYIAEMRTALAAPDIEFVAARTPAEAVTGADLVLTATTALEPVFPGEALAAGAHICGVGSYTPAMREIDLKTLRRAGKIVVDGIDAAWEEAGDLIIPWRAGNLAKTAVYGEIGEIVAGKKPGREDDQEITVFKSVGLAVQDLAVARLAYAKAVDAQYGTELDL